MSMDLDAPVALQTAAGVPKSSATILCCNCGTPIDGTTAAGALCFDCVKLTVDVTEGIQREAVIHTCRDCERWLSPPAQWMTATPESKELLALCLRKLTGLSKVRIIDAGFIWTEPHSRRIKVKLTVQSEYEGAIIQQTFQVIYVVHYQQCPDCQKSFTPNTWRGLVQVRQKVLHKRTFLYLEQLILKHAAHKDTINIKEMKNGLDFFFSQVNHADKFVDFLTSVAPVKTKKSQQIISEDTHTGKKSYKFTYSCELVPICKDDLVSLPLAVAAQAGNISPLVLCHRVGTTINVMDPQTLQTAEIQSATYWHTPFAPLADVQELVEFMVLDIEPLGTQHGRFFLAEATVARTSDMGNNDITFFTRTHLGAFLHPGDTVMGYLLSGANFNDPNFERLMEKEKFAAHVPDVVLVKKVYPRKKGAAKRRNWRLKRMQREESEMLPRKQDQERNERDYEAFLRDVEEDSELRQTMALYRNINNNNGASAAGKAATAPGTMDGLETADGRAPAASNGNDDGDDDDDGDDNDDDDDDDDDDDEVPKIDMSELLEDMEELGLEDGRQ